MNLSHLKIRTWFYQVYRIVHNTKKKKKLEPYICVCVCVYFDMVVVTWVYTFLKTHWMLKSVIFVICKLYLNKVELKYWWIKQIIMRYHYTLFCMVKMKTMVIPNVGKDTEQPKLSFPTSRGIQFLENSLALTPNAVHTCTWEYFSLGTLPRTHRAPRPINASIQSSASPAVTWRQARYASKRVKKHTVLIPWNII